MKEATIFVYNKLFEAYPHLEICRQSIIDAYRIINTCYKSDGKLLICGNGGSASDSEHIVGELMKGFLLKRKPDQIMIEKLKNIYPDSWKHLTDNLQGALPAISLTNHAALSTAFANDVAPDMVFAQQVFGYAKDGDVLLGLSTSGNSKNVINAIKIAKTLGIKTISMTGENGGKMKDLCDVTICAPANETYKVQEYHLPIYHTLCAMIEAAFFDM